MSEFQACRRPVLARGVRYRLDDVRQQHQLLFPEGMLVLNESGAAILHLCDGRSIEAIQNQLGRSYSSENLRDDICEFLDQLVQKGLIQYGVSS